MFAMIDVGIYELILRGLEFVVWIYDEIPA